MADTPNMNLTLPVVQETLGPTYAQLNNEAFEEIDSHDHTDGKGVLVPTAGLNINLDLPMNGFALTESNAVTFQTVVGTPALQSIYSSGGELYYRDDDGTAVQITVNGAVDAGVGNISGLGAYIDVNLDPRTSSVSFSDVTLDFSFFYDTGLLSAMNVGDIRLYPYDGIFTPYPNFITLKSPTALASDYSLTLAAALPASTQLMQVSSAGAISYTNTLTQPLRGADGSAAAPTYGFNTDTDNGMYLDTTNQIAFSAGGSRRLFINSTSLEMVSVPIYLSDGTASAPGLAFASDTNTGMYRVGADELGLSIGGLSKVRLSSTALVSVEPVHVNLGGQASPQFSFFDDPNTGMYSSSADTVSFTTGGTKRLDISTTAVTSTLPINTGGGAFKVSVYSGTIASGANLNLTPSGATTIYSASGYCQAVGTVVWAPMDISGAGYSDVYFNITGGTATTVRISGGGGSDRAYRVTIIHD